MATLTATGIADLVVTTLRDLGRLKFQQIAQSLQDYEVFSKWFRKDKVVFDSGIGIQRTLMTKTSGAARFVGLLEEDSVNIPDVLTQLQVDWRHLTTSWAFIYQETLMNRGRAMVLNVIEPRRADALLSMVAEIEDKSWACPAYGTTKEPYGVPYWIVTNATEGFNGGAPSGYTTVGGVNPSTYTTWKNWTAQYVTVNRTDLLKKMRTAHRKCNFKSPININDYRGGNGNRYRIYAGETVVSSLEDIATDQNENLGRDIAQLDNTVVFRNHPIIWIPKLDADTTYPLYMIDHQSFMPVCLRGDYLRESQALRGPNQHNAFQFFVDLSFNFLCIDRRRNAVFYK